MELLNQLTNKVQSSLITHTISRERDYHAIDHSFSHLLQIRKQSETTTYGR
jgi:hypothetical protein